MFNNSSNAEINSFFKALYTAKGDQFLVENNIKAVKNASKEDNDCCVCWEPSVRKSLLGLDCGHLFCG